MSFYSVDQANPHLHRSELAVPGSRPELFEKAQSQRRMLFFLIVKMLLPLMKKFKQEKYNSDTE